MPMKPCPFCGNEDINCLCRGGRYGHFVFMKCPVCGARGKTISVGHHDCVNDRCAEGEFCKDAERAYVGALAGWNMRVKEGEQYGD